MLKNMQKSTQNGLNSKMWRHTFIIPALSRMRQEDQELEAKQFQEIVGTDRYKE
jgi:hypothetical protein